MVRLLALKLGLPVGGLMLVLVALNTMFRSVRFRKGGRPALGITSEGILIGFTPGKPFFARWPEVAAVRTNANAHQSEQATWIAFEVYETETILARLDLPNRLAFWNSRGRFAVGTSLLGAPWPEIKDALNSHVLVLDSGERKGT